MAERQKTDQDESLKSIEIDVWNALESAITTSDSGFRFIVLSTVDQHGRPQSRTVVLRAVDTKARILDIYTDIRSQKWKELTTNPSTSLIGYDEQSRIQLRLTGHANLHNPNTVKTDKAWASMPSWTQETYAGGPPGDALSTGDKISEKINSGKEFFGVISFFASVLDWVQLERDNNRRALFEYDKNGILSSCRWVTP